MPRESPRVSSRSEPRPGDLLALLDGWASAGHGPLPRRLAQGLRRLMDAGVLPAGWRLPPERTLAQSLAVSRTTVTRALDELRDDGRVASRQGSGTFVVGSPTSASFGTRVGAHLSSGPGIDLAKGDASDLSHLPNVTIAMWQLEATCGGAAVNTAGLPIMRQAIADLYTRGGVTGRARPTGPDEIHITAGSHQGSYLLVSTLVPRGGAVAVPECSYPGIFDILDHCEARPVPVRVDRAGMIPESLDAVLRHDEPDLVYFQAGPLIPTGQVTPTGRLRALAEVLDRHRMTVLEDTTVAAVAFHGVAPMLADHCRTATLVSTGSLSKICFSGIRLGWIRAPVPLIDETIYRHLATDLGPSVPSQLLALELLPYLDQIATERRHRLESAVDAALGHLARAIPEAVIEPPDGNSVLWARFPVPDSTHLVERARGHGVRVAPGSIHFPDKAPGPFLRIDVDRPVELVHAGIQRLANAWRGLAQADAIVDTQRTSERRRGSRAARAAEPSG